MNVDGKMLIHYPKDKIIEKFLNENFANARTKCPKCHTEVQACRHYRDILEVGGNHALINIAKSSERSDGKDICSEHASNHGGQKKNN